MHGMLGLGNDNGARGGRLWNVKDRAAASRLAFRGRLWRLYLCFLFVYFCPHGQPRGTATAIYTCIPLSTAIDRHQRSIDSYQSLICQPPVHHPLCPQSARDSQQQPEIPIKGASQRCNHHSLLSPIWPQLHMKGTSILPLASVSKVKSLECRQIPVKLWHSSGLYFAEGNPSLHAPPPPHTHDLRQVRGRRRGSRMV